jgi:hypothetical protein
MPFTTLKTAVLAPIPTASVASTASVTTGVRAIDRRLSRTSRASVSSAGNPR